MKALKEIDYSRRTSHCQMCGAPNWSQDDRPPAWMMTVLVNHNGKWICCKHLYTVPKQLEI